MNKGFYDGVVILDFTQVIAGPFATMQLALQGADVIKVERPDGGDMMREIMSEPPYSDLRTSSGFIAFNSSKRSLTLDLKSEDAHKILEPLIERADVIVENFRPGVMASLGLDAATLRKRRPELVYCSITGFGQSGPKAGLRAYDGAIQAESGMMSVTGFPDSDPLRAGYFAVDVPTGYAAAFAISAALFKARSTGEGCHVDVAMMDTALSLMAMQVNEYFQNGVQPSRLGNMSAARIPSDNCYTTADGAIGVVALTPSQIANLNEVLGLAGDPTASDLAKVFKTATSSEWQTRLEKVAVPSAIVRDLPAALADEQLLGRSILDTPSSPTGLEDMALKVIGAPFTVEPKVEPSQAAPNLGEHTDEILLDAGFSANQIVGWRKANIV